MPSQASPDPVDDDVVQRLRAAGIVVPADRTAGTVAAARRLLSHLHWLRTPRTAAAEPAAIVALDRGAPR